MTMTMERSLSAVDVAALLTHAYDVMDPSDPSWADLVGDLASRANTLAVPYSRAAEFLHVSVPTVAAWADRGVLDRVEESTVRAVTARSLARAEAVLAGMEDRSNRRVLHALAEALRDADLVERAQHVIDSTSPSDFVLCTATSSQPDVAERGL